MAKRRVQAQRKFAQGAYIPPSNSERRNDTTPVKENGDCKKPVVNTILNHMSASHLLDIIAFQNIHEHKPYVLLENIKYENKTSNDPASEKENQSVTSNIKTKHPVKVITKLNNVGLDKRNVVIKRKTIKKRLKKNNMSLRSRIINRSPVMLPISKDLKTFTRKASHIIKRRVAATSNRKLVHVEINAHPLTLNKKSLRGRSIINNIPKSSKIDNKKHRHLKRKTPEMSEFSSEDETPLKLYNSAKKGDGQGQSKAKQKSYQLRSNRIQSPFEKAASKTEKPDSTKHRRPSRDSVDVFATDYTSESTVILDKVPSSKQRRPSRDNASKSPLILNKIPPTKYRRSSRNSVDVAESDNPSESKVILHKIPSSNKRRPSRDDASESTVVLNTIPLSKLRRFSRDDGSKATLILNRISPIKSRRPSRNFVGATPDYISESTWILDKVPSSKQRRPSRDDASKSTLNLNRISPIECRRPSQNSGDVAELDNASESINPILFLNKHPLPKERRPSRDDASKSTFVINKDPNIKEEKEDTIHVIQSSDKTVSTEKDDINPVNESLYSNVDEVQRWVDNTIDNASFKIPQTLASSSNKKRRVEKATCDEQTSSTSKQSTQAVTPCPSSVLKSVKTVQEVLKVDMKKSCNNCDHCKSLFKIINHVLRHETITKHTMPESVSAVNDIYNFDPETDLKDNQPFTEFRHTRQARKSSQDLHTDEKHFHYLDLLPANSSHVIQLLTVKVPHQVKPIMRARLIPKTEIRQTNNDNHTDEDLVVLSGQDNFLDQLLSSLNADSTNLKASTKNSKLGSSVKASRDNAKSFPRASESAQLVTAPTFYPTAAEFENPLAYIDKIRSEAFKFGLCKIVPPAGFKPECYIKDNIVFKAGNQYPGKMYTRWVPATRELCAIKKYLATQNVSFKRLPLIDGIEVNLPKLYHIVQKAGGLKEVIEKKKWQKLAEDMNFQKSQHVDKKLDQVYVKYLLPYDVLTNRERQTLLSAVDKEWNKKYKKMLERARNPLHRQKKILGESSSDEDDDAEEEGALDEADDCVVSGRIMNLTTFKKVAANSMHMYFKGEPSTLEVEHEYWRLVLLGDDHICVNTASIDTGEQGYGFSKSKEDPYSKHPWNLKVLSNSPGSVLRSLGPVLSVTVPTLHLGMVFTTSCWHRDPHGLPWIEYLHSGAPKIWYGIPDEQSSKFRKAVESLGPAYCQNKSIWLPSDITMIPPKLLMEHNVSLSKTIQQPGEYIVIFPRAYSCSVCTGFTVSESVYFGSTNWLMTVQNDFQEVRDSCEPTMFSLEQLLIAMACDSRVTPSVLLQVHSTLNIIMQDEASNRRRLQQLKITCKMNKQPPKKKSTTWNVREQAECDICRATLYLSKVTGITGRKSDYCLQHALRILEMPSNKDKDLSDVTLECFYSNHALDAILDRIRKRLCPTRE